jgi:DNA mismatch repair protein MutL
MPLRVAEPAEQALQLRRDSLEEPFASSAPELETPPLGFAIAQLHGVYILSQAPNGLILVDMHAAHERTTYEKMKRALGEGAVPSQPLLTPITLSVSPAEADVLEEYASVLNSVGLDLVRSGPAGIQVRAIPVFVRARELDELVRRLAADLRATGATRAVGRPSMRYSERSRAMGQSARIATCLFQR